MGPSIYTLITVKQDSLPTVSLFRPYAAPHYSLPVYSFSPVQFPIASTPLGPGYKLSHHCSKGQL